MLKEGCEMDPNEGQEELEEVQAELKKKDAEVCWSLLVVIAFHFSSRGLFRSDGNGASVRFVEIVSS